MENKYSIKSFYVSDEFQDTFKELDKYVKNNNVSKSYIIREAIKEYLKNHSFEEDKETVFQTLLKSE